MLREITNNIKSKALDLNLGPSTDKLCTRFLPIAALANNCKFNGLNDTFFYLVVLEVQRPNEYFWAKIMC